MPEEKVHHELLTEIKKLNLRLDLTERTNRTSRLPGVRHGWLKVFFKDLENNPQTQAKIHKWACVYWLCNFPIVLGLFFFAPHLWVAIGLLVNTVYSLYANLATDYGGLSAAQATEAVTGHSEAPVDPLP